MTSSTHACLLLIDPPQDGAWNMAVDEALLEAVAAGGSSALRFYGWSRATLSLGYFQSAAERAAHPASGDCPLVRRQTGGGAIVHDDELTYSLCLPLEHPLAADATRLYALVHEALIEVLAGWQIKAKLAAAVPSSLAREPFLCSQRRVGGDLLLDGAKIGGSAQRRLRGAILQHGSLLLGRSPAAPELKGIRELAGKSLDFAAVAQSAAAQFEQRLGLVLERSRLDPQVSQAAEALVARKYAADAWNAKR